MPVFTPGIPFKEVAVLAEQIGYGMRTCDMHAPHDSDSCPIMFRMKYTVAS